MTEPEKVLKVFVTGASGFIGGRLVDVLVNDGWNGAFVDVYCLASRLDPLRQRWGDRVQFIEGRLHNVLEYRSVIQSCTYVFHLAAAASLRLGAEGARTNLDGTRHLLDALRGSKSLRRLVFTSSIGAVDRQSSDPCINLLNEASACNPLSEYGRSKLACEQIIAVEDSIPWTIIRPTWVYGSGMRGDSHLRVFMDMVLNGRLLSRFNFPGRVSIIHVDDLVDALLLTAADEKAKSQIYFATDGAPVSIGELFAKIGQFGGVTGSGQLACSAPLTSVMRLVRPRLPLTAQNLFSDVLCADSSKLSTLGFRPKVFRDRGLLQTM
jgi:nucleoside-diphosphate-sugar epimerase